MPIDPTIANPATLKLDNPMEQFGNYLNNALVMDKIGELQAEKSKRNALATAYKNRLRGDGTYDRAGVMHDVAEAGQGYAIPEAEKAWYELDNTQAETTRIGAQAAKDEADTVAKSFENARMFFGGVSGDPNRDLPQFVQGINGVFNDPILGNYFSTRGITKDAMLQRTQEALKAGMYPKLVNDWKLGLEKAAEQEMQMLMERGRNTRNAADNQVSVANNMRTTGTSAANNIRTNNQSNVNNLRTTQASIGNNIRTNNQSNQNNIRTTTTSRENNIRGIASRAELQKRGFDFKRWQTDVKYADEMMDRGRLVSQILKKEFPWIRVGTIGRRSIEEQRTLWERSGRDPFMAAKPGTSLHGLGAAIDYGHPKIISREQLAKFHQRARELGIEMYDETASPNGAHQHGTIVAPPDMATLRAMLNGTASKPKLITDENYTRVEDKPGVKVPQRTPRVPDFSAKARQEFDSLYKDSGFMGTVAEKKAEMEKIRQKMVHQWMVDNGLATPTPAPMPSGEPGQAEGEVSREDFLRAWNWLQEERKRNAEIERNRSWTERNRDR